ncbi:protein FAM83G isoform X2 [Rana temporaria]|uniref:protein FAM83G isoform X2 n=1 Tax=Rana temporaria TaxID=8407 RepID=UPI001AADBDCB|nr:protein FAM83G isoform X2 [Rana temporaria]
MALSQLQCLDNHNVNWRSSETKPEFFYSEEQRLALEALVSTGEEKYHEVIKKENIRDFLSELEVAKVACRVEAFDPDLSHPRKNEDKPETEEEGEPPLEDTEQSLEYWPDRSDCSIPELDLGWPDTVAYRGVTRATVYMQPPIDGQPHIKEVIRKMITQAQKVIALVMDLFTDLDIFKDLLDAGFKRKVSVYIILNESDLKYFLQMCEKAQMHKGHLKNLRVRTLGGPEFYTRFSTKFKGCLSQKFMFVDGDKAACGSYSFTWSAARIDRNLLTVLSGQVVETFDRQFQELYLLSKGMSLKNVQMVNEPEPEPVIQPAAVPAGHTEAMARKMHNPKYALVTVKSASEAGKDSKKESDVVKKIAIKPRAAAREQPMDEPQLHPALQDMERANMFDYLPTWVEPEPEPGNEILGYINIIDPNIRNAQLSQMNRIKICDTSQATAQYMQQAKEIERQKQENSEHDHEDSKPPSQTSYNQEHQHSHMANPSRQTNQEQVVSGHINVSRQASLEQKMDPSSSKPDLSRQASHGRESQGSKDNPSTQRNQDLGYGSRQASLEQKPISDIETTISNLISLEESLLNTDIISVQQPNNADSAGQESPDVYSLQKSEGIAALAGNHHLLSHKPPPVPKPRTVPVTDFISMKNALNANSGRIATPTEEIPAPFVNGVEGDSEQIDILIENEPAPSEQDEESKGSAGEYSSSGSGSLPKSNASSMSEEYYPSTSLQRRSSDRIPNGERPSLQRKLSDSHISRGSFSSPLISQTFMDARSMENGKRRNTLEEELNRVLSSSHPLQGKDRLFSLETPQEKNNFQYTSNGPPGGYDRFSSQHGARNVGNDRGQREVGMDGPSAYRHVNRKSEGLASRPGLWSAKDYGKGYTSPGSQSPVPTDNASTPFGIPFSKLSQTKHLKSKLGTTNLDSRRRSHGPPGHKDL